MRWSSSNANSFLICASLHNLASLCADSQLLIELPTGEKMIDQPDESLTNDDGAVYLKADK